MPSDGTDYQSLPNAVVALLPTPAVNDILAAYTPETWDEWTATMKAKHNNGNGHGKSLNVEAQRLLPTPTSRDSHNAGDPDRTADRMADRGQPLSEVAVNALLPTTNAKGAAQSAGSSPSDVTLTDANIRTRLGEQENPRHAQTSQGGPRKELRGVRNAAGPEAIRERPTGGPERLPEAEALLSQLCEQPSSRPGGHAPLEGAPGQAPSSVRGLRDGEPSAACASRRPGCDEQRAGESNRALCVMPPAPALAGGSGRSHGVDFGAYEAAIQRWEAVLGRSAPTPTELNTKGNAKLSAAFDEFLMGYPTGWITDVPGVTWNEALKACGNGVVPQQGAAALRFLLTMGGVA